MCRFALESRRARLGRSLALPRSRSCCSCCPRPAAGQGVFAFSQRRPFVIGLLPVVGRNGAVGGVSIDAKGVVARSDVDQSQRLRDARLKALQEIGGDLQAAEQAAQGLAPRPGGGDRASAAKPASRRPTICKTSPA